MSELVIRPFRSRDRDPLVALWDRCGLLVSYNDPDRDIALWRATPTAEIFVGEIDERLVASICIGHDGHRGYPYYVAVDPEARGKGHGRALMRHGETWLARRGVPKMNVLVRESNDAVRAFYRTVGYRDWPTLVMGRFLTPDGARPAAPGLKTLTYTVTYLEMTARPTPPPTPLPRGVRAALLRARAPSVGFYRYLYDTIGAPWLWYERREMDDDALGAIVGDARVEIYVLYVDGVPAGYAELDRRAPPEIELAYFGLMPDFIGRGLGSYLLRAAIDIAWSHEPSRLWVQTNTLDHPRALPLYQRLGFRPVKQVEKTVPDPRPAGSIPGEPRE